MSYAEVISRAAVQNLPVREELDCPISALPLGTLFYYESKWAKEPVWWGPYIRIDGRPHYAEGHFARETAVMSVGSRRVVTDIAYSDFAHFRNLLAV